MACILWPKPLSWMEKQICRLLLKAASKFVPCQKHLLQNGISRKLWFTASGLVKSLTKFW